MLCSSILLIKLVRIGFHSYTKLSQENLTMMWRRLAWMSTLGQMNPAFIYELLLSSLKGMLQHEVHSKLSEGASLVAQWQRICLPMQETWV